ncbi:uncharacterized protein EV422DRAFT_514651, partial [Fimicolochytrium jonesii]|uniref:uncharacterized protein n=1 Tax=Fimicolochytrium jonesii TaxID=1396493 RepID=UPI0022FE11F6
MGQLVDRKGRGVDDLPLELLYQVLQYVSFRQSRVAMGVSRSFRNAAMERRELTLQCSKAVIRLGLAQILASYPVLETLNLEPVRNTPLDEAESYLEIVGRQFAGHSTLRTITCSCVAIVPGAVDNCPQLTTLVVRPGRMESDAVEEPQTGQEPSEQPPTLDGPASSRPLSDRVDRLRKQMWTAPGLKRNVAWILRNCTKLQHLEMEEPRFWARPSVLQASVLGRGPSAISLQYLQLTGMSASALLNFASFLAYAPPSPNTGVASLPALPNLRTLLMEIDYAFLPTTMLPSLAIGCPNLEALTLKTLDAPPALVADIATHLNGLRNIRSLVLYRCSVWFDADGWLPLTRVICRALTGLKTLQFNGCCLRELPRSTHSEVSRLALAEREAGNMLGWTHLLENLKITPVEGTPSLSLADMKGIVTSFPQLRRLKVTGPAATLTAEGMPAWAGLVSPSEDTGSSGLGHLEELTVRCRSASELTEEPTDSLIPLHLPNLTHLHLFSTPVFPITLLTHTASTLTVLKLEGIPAILPSYVNVALPNLQRLSIWNISTLGHRICLETAASLTHQAPRLEALTMESLVSSRSLLDLPDTFMEDLIYFCKGIKHLRLQGFNVSTKAFNMMASAAVWPELSTLHVRGRECLPVVDCEWERVNLAALIRSHRRLSSLHLGFSGIGSDLVDVIRCGVSNERKHAEDEVKAGGGMYRQRQEADVLLYAAYARYLSSRWWWVEDISLSGPVVM